MANVIEIKDHVIALEKPPVGTKFETSADFRMSYDEFFTNFLVANRPCVFDPDITTGWRCRREWVANGAPNFQTIARTFGNCEAPVADCRKKYYNSQLKNDMTVSRYLDYWMELREKNYNDEMPLLYLKDWHCVKDNSDVDIYEVPNFFASDWLNEFYMAHSELEDDYMFVYMGPKGSWTPFHADVFMSYSWSANIVGKKRWLLFPPGEENHFRDSHGQLSFDVQSGDLNDRGKYPNYDERELKSIEIIQETGQIIFVPSGWHHQVWNLDDTVSINHNWINGCNVQNVWLALKNQLSAVMREVEDCRDMEDWEKHCQIMLKATHGINYPQFRELLCFVVEKRLKSLNDNSQIVRSLGTWTIGPNHSLFDVKQAKIVLNCLIEDAKEKNIYDIVFPNDDVQRLLDEINLLSNVT